MRSLTVETRLGASDGDGVLLLENWNWISATAADGALDSGFACMM